MYRGIFKEHILPAIKRFGVQSIMKLSMKFPPNGRGELTLAEACFALNE